ncbi:MBT domain-containing protein 1-like [Brevipalpus obovatus]|uniref:MBT domain-containing protein 1-like n=1 Tax=Brevipalpus obovatus TaxID=246614 RepID=UPI003D9EFC99
MDNSKSEHCYRGDPPLDEDLSFSAAPVSSFKHCPLADVWNNFVTVGLKVEVKNRDVPSRNNQIGNNHSSTKNSKNKSDYYWIASVVKVAGYFIRLRYEGFENGSADFWVNILSNQIHSVGWCASQGKVLIPPKAIAEKYSDWKAILVKSLTGSPTLPENFVEQLRDSLKSRMKVGTRLECVDKCRISAVRTAIVSKIIGCRLHLKYEGDEEDDGFWCHQDSPLIHPVGWAQVVGHELKATPEYARSSLEKVIDKKFDVNDAKWSLFPVPKYNPVLSGKGDIKFREGMKLEAIDPLNLSTICPATVTKVLRNNYLMVGIDGVMADDGSDWFCYHASSPNILPVGFCMLNNIPLTPPKEYPKEFEWYEYLQATHSNAAPVHLFKRDLPNHGFKEGMYLEAVDLMVPKLVCVATIKKVVGRLLRIHFNGWDETYDQWCDCESPELYPIGWCQMVGYPLEPPKDPNGNETTYTGFGPLDSRQKKRSSYKGKYKKRKHNSQNASGMNMSATFNYFEKASTSDHLNTSGSSLSSLSNNNEWTPTAGSEASSGPPPSSDQHGMSSSVVIKPSPIQPLLWGLPGEKLPDDPRHWSVSHVSLFLQANDCGAYCHNFSERKIDGSQMLKMSRDDLLKITNDKLGPVLKIYALIQSLRGSKKFH